MVGESLGSFMAVVLAASAPVSVAEPIHHLIVVSRAAQLPGGLRGIGPRQGILPAPCLGALHDLQDELLVILSALLQSKKLLQRSGDSHRAPF